MEWRLSKPEDFPLATVSLMGEWIKIDPEKEDLQYIVSFDESWLINPPEIYDRAWMKLELGLRDLWKWGTGRNRIETERALLEGRPTEFLLQIYNKAMDELDPIILPSAPTMRRRRLYNMDDGEPDVEIALSGVDEFLVRRHKTSTNNRIVHLAWQLAQAHVESEIALARQAACAVAVTNHLEKYGYRVRLTGYIGLKVTGAFRRIECENILSEKSNHLQEVLLMLPIKHENAPIDEHKALTFGLPGVLRHYSFAWLSSIFGADIDKLSSGFGKVLYGQDFINAVSRRNKISAVVTSDAPQTMQTIIQEI